MKKIFTLFAALAMVMSMSAKPYLRGSFNSWGTSNEFQNGECTIHLAANTKYEFKVDNNGDWSTSYGGAAITSTKCTDVSCSGSNNATIQTTLKGSYTFKWNASTKKISVVYPTEEVIKPKKDITVKAKMPAHWTKTIDAWVWTDEDGNGKVVTPERDGDWYVITQNTAASYIIFRNGATWNGDANQTVDMRFEDNACIQLAQSGSSKATYTNIDCVSEYTLTATANPAEGGSVTGAGVYEEGTTVTLTATPNEGYEFVSWTNGGAVVSTNATYSFVIKKNLALVANFKAVEATVYTISTEAVNGTVTGAGVYEEDATVTLTATPADGYNFKNWTVSGAEVSAENPYIFTATADVTVTANFEEIPVEYETVYFVNAQDWEKVCIYTWTPEIGTWPGKEMTKEAEQIGGKDVYSYTIEKGTTFVGLNFNNGDNGKQTGNLTWTAGKYYVIDNWYTKEEAEEKLATPVQTYDYYITGSLVGGWNPDQHGLEKDGELYKATFTELNAGIYEFKITAGDWEHQWNYSNLGAAYEEVSEGVDGEGNPNGNIKIVTEEAKNITVIFDATAGKITLEGLTEKVVTPDTPDTPATYYVTGNDALLGAAAWNPAAIAMTEVEGVYTHTFTAVAAGVECQLKVTEGDWLNGIWGYDNLSNTPDGVTTDSDRNIVFTLAEAGDVVVTFDGEKITVEGNFAVSEPEPVVMTTIYLNTGGSALWNNSGAKFFAHSWKEGVGNEQDKELTLVEGDLYKLDVPEDHDMIIFLRLAPGATDVVWSGDNYWNQTENLTIPSDQNCYTITEWGADYNPVCKGTWSSYTYDDGNALDNVNTTIAPVKAIVNGQLVIIRDGVKYNVQGAVVK